jgi:UPF0716 protein FxsA
MRLGFFGIIAVAFLALEIVGIYLIGNRLGGWATAFWLLLDGILGVLVIRRAGAEFPTLLRDALQSGHAPLAPLWATGRRFLGGALLIVPGPFSDLIALPLLLWPSPPTPPARRMAAHDDVIEGEFRREE